MKTHNNIIPIIAILFSNLIGFSQEQVTIIEEKEITINLPKDYSKTLNLFIFPKENQDTLEQTNDMKDCYVWAYHQTNFDPLNPTKVEVKPVGKIPKGTAVVGAARGAAAGAAIGSVTGNMGDGAAIGAINGVIRGRRASRNAKKQHINNNIQAASNAERNLKLNFNKAFSACIKAKGYSVE